MSAHHPQGSHVLLNLRRLALPEAHDTPTLTAIVFNPMSRLPETQHSAMLGSGVTTRSVSRPLDSRVQGTGYQ